MSFLKFASGWDSWYEHPDRKEVANAALDVMARWSKGGVTPVVVRELCAGEGHPRDEQDLIRGVGGYALAVGSVPMASERVTSCIPSIPSARTGATAVVSTTPAPQSMTQPSGGESGAQ